MSGVKRRVSAVLLSLMQVAAHAAPLLSASDCAEGAHFIHNAALSRDNGMPARQFIERFDADVATVMAMPPQVRWFVYSEAEAQLLRDAVDRVFTSPDPADRHRAEFLAACDRLRAQQACTDAAACEGGPVR